MPMDEVQVRAIVGASGFRWGMREGMPMSEKLDRMSMPEPMSGCTLWLGAKTLFGYGQVWDGRRTVLAHRVVWEMERGPIPEGLVIDHRCRNPACINPDHLRVVTERENILCGTSRSAQQAKRTHCPQGHPYDVAKADGGRGCRQCRNAAQRAYNARQREKAA